MRGGAAVCELALGVAVECVVSLARFFFRGCMAGCQSVGMMAVSVKGGAVDRQEGKEVKNSGR